MLLHAEANASLDQVEFPSKHQTNDSLGIFAKLENVRLSLERSASKCQEMMINNEQTE